MSKNSNEENFLLFILSKQDVTRSRIACVVLILFLKPYWEGTSVSLQAKNDKSLLEIKRSNTLDKEGKRDIGR